MRAKPKRALLNPEPLLSTCVGAKRSYNEYSAEKPFVLMSIPSANAAAQGHPEAEGDSHIPSVSDVMTRWREGLNPITQRLGINDATVVGHLVEHKRNLYSFPLTM